MQSFHGPARLEKYGKTIDLTNVGWHCGCIKTGRTPLEEIQLHLEPGDVVIAYAYRTEKKPRLGKASVNQAYDSIQGSYYAYVRHLPRIGK